MSNHHPHNDILESKLRQLPGADANHLWNGMQAILDKQMPEKKKRPGIFWWLFTKRTLYVSVTALASAITAYAFLYTPAEKQKQIISSRMPLHLVSERNRWLQIPVLP